MGDLPFARLQIKPRQKENRVYERNLETESGRKREKESLSVCLSASQSVNELGCNPSQVVTLHKKESL